MVVVNFLCGCLSLAVAGWCFTRLRHAGGGILFLAGLANIGIALWNFYFVFFPEVPVA